MYGQGELGYDEVVLSPGGGPDGVAGRAGPHADRGRRAARVPARDHGLSRISRRLVSSGALDVVAAAAPGIKDILLLGKVKQLERAGVADLIVLTPPLRAPSPSWNPQPARHGERRAHQRPGLDVLELLEDHRRCQVILVTIPEETPVNEAVETAFSLE